MPYKLRKAPNQNKYWVVGEDGRKYSRLPIPLERAKAQKRLLTAVEYGWKPTRRPSVKIQNKKKKSTKSTKSKKSKKSKKSTSSTKSKKSKKSKKSTSSTESKKSKKSKKSTSTKKSTRRRMLPKRSIPSRIYNPKTGGYRRATARDLYV